VLGNGLLSKSIVGIAEELEASVTAFAAQVLTRNGESRVYWMPIEGYDRTTHLVPPHYNAFCHLLRLRVRANLVLQFQRTTQMYECPFSSDGPQYECRVSGGPCWAILAAPKPVAAPGRTIEGSKTLRATEVSDGATEGGAAQADWTRCPLFLDLLEEKCPCYQSDLKLIQEVRRRFEAGHDSPIVVREPCFAAPGLQEIAMPVVIHDHLVGVAMTGQFVKRGACTASSPVPALCKICPSLEPSDQHNLDRYWSILNDLAQPDLERREERELLAYREIVSKPV